MIVHLQIYIETIEEATSKPQFINKAMLVIKYFMLLR
jgi:hypothetical protein